MRQHLSQKQEMFCLEYFRTTNATQSAITAGYSPKTAKAMASENLTKPDIQARLAELRKKTETASVMTVLERKERLSEIARARLTDYMELGQDGSWVNIGKETPGGAAIQEIHSRTEYDKNGASPTVYTSVKLHDPVRAMDLLNKMDKIYTDGSTTTVVIFNQFWGDVVKLFLKVNEIPDPEERMIAFAMGADRIAEGKKEE